MPLPWYWVVSGVVSVVRVGWDSSSLLCDQVLRRTNIFWWYYIRKAHSNFWRSDVGRCLKERKIHINHINPCLFAFVFVFVFDRNENEIDLHQIHPCLCLWFHLMSPLVHAQRLKSNHYQGVNYHQTWEEEVELPNMRGTCEKKCLKQDRWDWSQMKLRCSAHAYGKGFAKQVLWSGRRER